MPDPRNPRPPRTGRVFPLRRAVAAPAPGEAAASPHVNASAIAALAVLACAAGRCRPSPLRHWRLPGFAAAMTMVSQPVSRTGPSGTWSRGGAPIAVPQESSAARRARR